jgi:hypothetical protein
MPHPTMWFFVATGGWGLRDDPLGHGAGEAKGGISCPVRVVAVK